MYIMHIQSDNYMHGLEYSSVFLQGYKQKKAYIIAEGPMESTTRNMWKLIYDRKCGVVVMLSDLLEDGIVSCGLKVTV